ncbi:hypothetical protein A6X21_04410 [Planctopirus hydrillae]|uniref:Cytochrome c domain-containing protein n=1 Tax=Planctopirus hydrillae TaxID=1841610 RepID=A0A1C3ENV5_9PLAN|nr:hypothetical protein A6X21_04410 [Planctopirus hydrillae]
MRQVLFNRDRPSQRRWSFFAWPLSFSLWFILNLPVTSSAEPTAKTVFEQKIAPIFVKHCVKCHGPEKQESGFRLDRRDDFLNGGDNGPAVVSQHPEESRLMHLVNGTDADVVMPPDGNRLSDQQKADLKQWIKLGADWPEKLSQLPGLPK